MCAAEIFFSEGSVAREAGSEVSELFEMTGRERQCHWREWRG